MSPGGLFGVRPAPLVALRADLKVRRPLSLGVQFLLCASLDTGPSCGGSPGGPVPLCSSSLSLPTFAHTRFNASIVAAAHSTETPTRSLSPLLPFHGPLGEARSPRMESWAASSCALDSQTPMAWFPAPLLHTGLGATCSLYPLLPFLSGCWE